MANDLIQNNAELGRFLFCERYTLQPVKNALYIAEGQDLKRGAVVDVNGVLVGTNSLIPYAVLENDCDTRAKGAYASVFVKGEFNFDKLFFADGLSKEDLDNIVYNGSKVGIVIKPYNYSLDFSPKSDEYENIIPEDASEENKLATASDVAEVQSNVDEADKQLAESIRAAFEDIYRFQPIAANTMRFSFGDLSYDPTIAGAGTNGTWKKLTGDRANIWDFTKNTSTIGADFADKFTSSTNTVRVIACGTLPYTVFYQTFKGCTYLEEVCSLDAPNLTSLNQSFNGCTRLKKVPEINSTVLSIATAAFAGCTGIEVVPLFKSLVLTNVSNCFNGCNNVKSGALSLYQQLIVQNTPPTTYTNAFKDCGKDTASGAAELAQIPASWGGTAAG